MSDSCGMSFSQRHSGYLALIRFHNCLIEMIRSNLMAIEIRDIVVAHMQLPFTYVPSVLPLRIILVGFNLL